MLLVVAYHCMVFWTGTWFTGKPLVDSNFISTVSLWMNSFHIYGFALVSGYLFYFMKCEKGKYSSFIPFAVNKVKRLLVPYIFASLVWVIPFAVYFFHFDAADIITRYVVAISPNQLWFLLMLFFVFMIFYPLASFFEDHNSGGAFTVLVFCGIGLLGLRIIPNIFQVLKACTYLPLFWLGFKIRQYGSQAIMKIPSLIWITVDVLLFTLVQYLLQVFQCACGQI